jgi:hypothetical protein
VTSPDAVPEELEQFWGQEVWANPANHQCWEQSESLLMDQVIDLKDTCYRTGRGFNPI